MKIRKVFEKLQDPDDMFEIFKDIVDDVMVIELDKEIDYEFKKGQIEISQKSQEIYLNPDPNEEYSYYEITESANWGFQFTMPDIRESKKRLQQRIIDIFKRETGVEISAIELVNIRYSHQHPEVMILFSKTEWISWAKNLKDFEEGHAEFDEYTPAKYQNINPIWDYYFKHPNKKNRIKSDIFTYIFEVSKGIGLKVDFSRDSLLQKMNIENNELTYETTYYPVYYEKGSWNILTTYITAVDGGSEIDFAGYNNTRWLNIDEYMKNKLIKAANDLNIDLKIDLTNLYQDNIELFAKFLTENIFPLIENKDSKLIGNIEDQFIKLEENDNISITSDMSKDESSIIWLCETEFNDKQHLFKIILDIDTENVKVCDNNKILIRCSIDELSDALFLIIKGNKLSTDN